MASAHPQLVPLAEVAEGDRDRARLLIGAAYDLLDESGLEGLTIERFVVRGEGQVR